MFQCENNVKFQDGCHPCIYGSTSLNFGEGHIFNDGISCTMLGTAAQSKTHRKCTRETHSPFLLGHQHVCYRKPTMNDCWSIAAM